MDIQFRVKNTEAALFLTLALLFQGFPSRIQAQMISDTLINGSYACQGSEITFTCVTRGSLGITWISDKFIGTGGVELGFSAEIDDPGQTYSVQTTVATLMDEYDDGGVQVLESTLQIIATAGSLTPSVTCRDERTSMTDTVNFKLLGKPDVPENVLPVQISHHNNSCAVLVIWHSNENRNLTHYSVYRNNQLMTSDALPINDTWMLSLFSVPCGQHNISVNATNLCGESSRSSSQIQHNLTMNISLECVATTEPSDASMRVTVYPTTPPSPCPIPAILVLVVLLAVICIVLVVIIVLFMLYIHKLKKCNCELKKCISDLKKQECATHDKDKKNHIPTPTDSETKVSPL